MKNFIVSLCLIITSSVCYGNEFIVNPNIATVQSYVYQQYITVQNPLPTYVISRPVAVLQYVPVQVYQNVIVEQSYWRCFRQYQVVPVVNTFYVPYTTIKYY